LNPVTGRFLTADQFNGFVSKPASLNKYLYAENTPPNATDPTGHFSVLEIGITLAIASVLLVADPPAKYREVTVVRVRFFDISPGEAGIYHHAYILAGFPNGSDALYFRGGPSGDQIPESKYGYLVGDWGAYLPGTVE
jgi:hypothetical protein